MFEGYTREQLRRSYAEAWAKHLAGVPLTALEAQIIDVISAHSEYQGIVSDVDAALSFEPGSSGGAENPFLHMGLHLAVREQLSIDRPPGIRELHHQLQARYGDAHERRPYPHGGARRDVVASAAQRAAAGRSAISGAGTQPPCRRPMVGQRLTKLHARFIGADECGR